MNSFVRHGLWPAALLLSACAPSVVVPDGPLMTSVRLDGQDYVLRYDPGAETGADEGFRIVTMSVAGGTTPLTRDDAPRALNVVRAFCAPRSDPACLRVKDGIAADGEFASGAWIYRWALRPGSERSLD